MYSLSLSLPPPLSLINTFSTVTHQLIRKFCPCNHIQVISLSSVSSVYYKQHLHLFTHYAGFRNANDEIKTYKRPMLFSMKNLNLYSTYKALETKLNESHDYEVLSIKRAEIKIHVCVSIYYDPFHTIDILWKGVGGCQRGWGTHVFVLDLFIDRLLESCELILKYEHMHASSHNRSLQQIMWKVVCSNPGHDRPKPLLQVDNGCECRI